MKKLLLSLVTVIGIASNASADTALFYAGSLPDINATNSIELVNGTDGNVLGETYTAGPISINFTQVNNSASNVANNGQLRWYQGDILTITNSSSQPITNVTVQAVSSYSTAFTANSGEVEEAGNNVIVWTGNVNTDLELTSTKQVRFTYLLVTYGESSGNTPSVPSTPEAPTGTITVAQALELMGQGYEGEATVKGIITKIDDVSTSYGNATYYIADTLEASEVLEVYRGKYLNGEAFTATDQIAVGGTVTVSGKLVNYNGTFEFTTGSSILEYVAPAGGGDNNGDDDNPETPEAPTGTITVAQALELMGQGYEGEATVKGIITKINEVSTSYGNATYFIADALEATEVLEVFRGYYLNGEKFTAEDQIVVGATVTVSGKLVNYNGTFEFTSGSSILEYVAPAGGGDNNGDDDNPETPEAPTGTITVAQALELMGQGYEGEATVKGFITKIDEVNLSYGNATYYIADALEATAVLEVYRGKYLNGEAFTAENQIAVGGTVTVSGKLVNYNGTFEFTTGSSILEYVAPANTPENPEPEIPENPDYDSAEFDFSDLSSLNATLDGEPFKFDNEEAEEYDVTDVVFTDGPISIVGSAVEDVTNVPRLFYSSSSNNPAWTYRFYNQNSITISAEENVCIAQIVFVATNLGNEAINFVGDGTFANNVWTATEDAEVSEVVINKTASGNNPAITSMTVYYYTVENTPGDDNNGDDNNGDDNNGDDNNGDDNNGDDNGEDGPTGAVNSIDIDNTQVEYFNLQGVKVNNPSAGGLYIRRQGDNVSKVIIR